MRILFVIIFTWIYVDSDVTINNKVYPMKPIHLHLQLLLLIYSFNSQPFSLSQDLVEKDLYTFSVDVTDYGRFLKIIHLREQWRNLLPSSNHHWGLMACYFCGHYWRRKDAFRGWLLWEDQNIRKYQQHFHIIPNSYSLWWFLYKNRGHHWWSPMGYLRNLALLW